MTLPAIRYRIRTLYATAAVFTADDPVLMEGEQAHESDTGKEKIGDGVTAWAALPYKAGGREKPARFAVTSPDAEVKFGLVLELGGTVSKITSAVLGTDSPSVTFTLRYGSDMTQAGTEVVTGGVVCAGANVVTSSFDNATVAAEQWLWCEVTAVSGVVDSVSVSVEF